MTQNKPIVLLAIESSCDDTSAAVMRDGILLSNVTASQAVHEQYGGDRKSGSWYPNWPAAPTSNTSFRW